jgi:SAM-dependent methyltransferase
MTQARYDAVADFYVSGFDSVDDPATRGLLDLLDLLDLLGPVAGLRVVDVACGHGRITRELARRGAHGAGIDISGQLIGKAGAWPGLAQGPALQDVSRQENRRRDEREYSSPQGEREQSDAQAEVEDGAGQAYIHPHAGAAVFPRPDQEAGQEGSRGRAVRAIRCIHGISPPYRSAGHSGHLY